MTRFYAIKMARRTGLYVALLPLVGLTVFAMLSLPDPANALSLMVLEANNVAFYFSLKKYETARQFIYAALFVSSVAATAAGLAVVWLIRPPRLRKTGYYLVVAAGLSLAAYVVVSFSAPTRDPCDRNGAFERTSDAPGDCQEFVEYMESSF